MEGYRPICFVVSFVPSRPRMTLDVPVNFETVNWVLSFGRYVEVIKPEKLREQVREALSAALVQYEPR